MKKWFLITILSIAFLASHLGTNVPSRAAAAVITSTPPESAHSQAEDYTPGRSEPGTHLVASGITPGIYGGEAPERTSCHWARLDASGVVIASENAIGQYYVEVLDTDHALQTGCSLVALDMLPPAGEYPGTIRPGGYIVGRDIKPGTYRGQSHPEHSSCYWAKLADATGDQKSIIDNDIVTGQFHVQVTTGDFALVTACKLIRTRE